MGKHIDLVGHVYGRLLVVAHGGRDSKDRILWLCRCECGTEKNILSSKLRSAQARSCGCAWAERKAGMGARKYSRTHGLSRTPTHKSWDGMMQRCTNPNHKAYKRYGAVGIGVCERWSTSFTAFVEDMGIRPAGMSIDRIDGAKGYEPSNCKWSTHHEQAHNRRSTKLDPVSVTQIRWLCGDGGFRQQEVADAFGVCQSAISQVVLRQHWADVA